MKKRSLLVPVLAVGALSATAFGAHDTKADFYYADTVGTGANAGVKGNVVFVTLPSGEHEVFFRLAGLAPNSGEYANHLHFNDAKDATCAAQNGDKVLPLSNLKADANGVALAYTRLPASVKFPEGTTYFNVHANTPNAVGGSISCGAALLVKKGMR